MGELKRLLEPVAVGKAHIPAWRKPSWSFEYGEAVVLTMYEPMAFYLPGGRYKPDFMHILESGSILFVEVKGSTKQRGYRDSRAKLRAAAEVFPFFYWCMSTDLVIERINVT